MHSENQDFNAKFIESKSHVGNDSDVEYLASDRIYLEPGFRTILGSKFLAATDCGSSDTWQFEYAIKDHLGNTRVLFADLNGNGNINENTEILQENHYYPFGMKMTGEWNNRVKPNYAYQYNGKELNEAFDLDWANYGARFYDPSIGRFTGVDPISDQFPELSTYNYASNDPIKNIDLHGLQGIRADMAFADPGLNAVDATPQERRQYQKDIATGFATGVAAAGAVYASVVAAPVVAGAVETSGTTIAINASVDAAVQTVTNIAEGEHIIKDFDIVGTISSAMSNPIVGSLIDGVVDVTANGSDINSAEEAVVGTAIGGGMGKAFGGIVDDIANSGQKLLSDAVNAFTGLFKDTNETVAKKLADENSQ